MSNEQYKVMDILQKYGNSEYGELILNEIEEVYKGV